MNQAEANGWNRAIELRTKRIFALAFLILLVVVFAIAAWLFVTGV